MQYQAIAHIYLRISLIAYGLNVNCIHPNDYAINRWEQRPFWNRYCSLQRDLRYVTPWRHVIDFYAFDENILQAEQRTLVRLTKNGKFMNRVHFLSLQPYHQVVESFHQISGCRWLKLLICSNSARPG